MTATMQPIKIWTSAPGPNGWKPIIFLEELGIPYEIVNLPFSELIGDEFRKINPNGKIPVMHDPNTDIQIWESGAIILYLMENYDKDNKLSFPRSQLKDYHLAHQWLVYQVAQQGPYYGQAGWFNWLHHEKLPSAIDRYNQQVHRILKVLDGALAASPADADGEKWLVGNKCSYADLSYVMYHQVVDVQMKSDENNPGASVLEQYPHVHAWDQRMRKRASVEKVVKMREEAMAKEGFVVDEESLGKKMAEAREKDEERAAAAK